MSDRWRADDDRVQVFVLDHLLMGRVSRTSQRLSDGLSRVSPHIGHGDQPCHLSISKCLRVCLSDAAGANESETYL